MHASTNFFSLPLPLLISLTEVVAVALKRETSLHLVHISDLIISAVIVRPPLPPPSPLSRTQPDYSNGTEMDAFSKKKAATCRIHQLISLRKFKSFFKKYSNINTCCCHSGLFPSGGPTEEKRRYWHSDGIITPVFFRLSFLQLLPSFGRRLGQMKTAGPDRRLVMPRVC